MWSSRVDTQLGVSMERHKQVCINDPPHSEACFYFGLGYEQLRLTTGPLHDRPSNLGSQGCETCALSLSYLAILTVFSELLNITLLADYVNLPDFLKFRFGINKEKQFIAGFRWVTSI